MKSLFGLMIILAVLVMSSGCVTLNDNGASVGGTVQYGGYGVTIEAVVKIESPNTDTVPVNPTNDVPVVPPVVPVTDSDEVSHGLDFTKAQVQGQFKFGSLITAKVTKVDTSNGGVVMEWQKPSTWQLDNDCDGVVCVAWKENGAWKYGYFDYSPKGSGWSYSAGQLANIYVGYNAQVNADDEVGFFIGSTNGERSNVVFTKWPINRSRHFQSWVTQWPHSANTGVRK